MAASSAVPRGAVFTTRVTFLNSLAMRNLSVSEYTVFKIFSAVELVGVLVLSFLPPDSVEPIRLRIGDSPEIGHVVAYALLVCGMLLSIRREMLTLWRGAAIAAALSALGLAIELLQPLVGRSTSVIDFAENEMGIVAGIVMFSAWFFVESARAIVRRP